MFFIDSFPNQRKKNLETKERRRKEELRILKVQQRKKQ